jgi:hypothetical protein
MIPPIGAGRKPLGIGSFSYQLRKQQLGYGFGR